ncbi:MAG: 4-hydroxybenzoate octaprenyltransferase [Magnetococcales bacterium]|nr:4-hydroxybenzoate octaprenyltransferase [Magnetococcales bacterium]
MGAMAFVVEKVPWRLPREMLKLMRVDRPIGTWLLMWPALWGLFAAQNGRAQPMLVAIFVLGSFVMRSAGCVANDLADRRFDAQVARTRERPLAAGRIEVAPAVGLLLFLLAIALWLALQLPPLIWKLAGIGALLAVTYPLTKRIVSIPQVYMGAAFGWGAVMGWAAGAGRLDAPAGWLFAATLAWATGYDTIYGMMDRSDDVRIGVRSTALLFGSRVRLAVAVCYAAFFFCLLMAGHHLALHWPYGVAVALVAAHLLWQLKRLRDERTEVLLRTFLSNQWVGPMLFLGIVFG